MTDEGEAATAFATWLDPREALKRVSQVVENVTPSSVILGRLKGGQVHAVAESFTKENRGHGIVDSGAYFEIPPEYWSHLTSESFWNSGDVDFEIEAAYYSINFETEIVRCYTIKFDPRGIQKLIATFPKSAPDFSAWLAPRMALNLISGSYSSRSVAEAAIHERLKGGLIKAHAESSAKGEHGGLATAPLMIPSTHWGYLAGPTGAKRFWETGDARMFISGRGTASETVRYYGVKFEPNGVRALIQEPEPAPSSQPSVQPLTPVDTIARKGGPTPKEWWDDLWIEMFRRIHFGEFTPKKQADLENAMHEWLAQRGKSACERTIRNAAKKLFEALKEKGQ